MPDNIKIYIAARYSRKEQMVQAAEIFKRNGIEVTSRWLDEKWSPNIQLHEVHASSLSSYAKHDFEDIDAADAIVFFSEDPEFATVRGGRHVEFGYAYGRGKKVVVIGPKENVFHYSHGITVVPTIARAVDALKEFWASKTPTLPSEISFFSAKEEPLCHS